MSKNDFHIEAITTDEQLLALRHEWNRLSSAHPFRTWEWLATWWKHYQQPEWRLWVLTVRDSAGALQGIAPWYLESTVGQGHVLRFLASGKVCSDYATVLARPDACADVARAVAGALHDASSPGQRGRSLTWDLLELEGVTRDAMLDELADQARYHHMTWNEKRLESCWQVRLPATWEEFIGGLEKRYRQKARSVWRNCVDAERARLDVATDATQRASFLASLIDLHQRRRASLGQDGCFDCSRFTSFVTELVDMWGNDGSLRLFRVVLDDQIAAAGIGFVGGDTLYMYQCGLEPKMLSHQPGWLLNLLLIRHCQTEGLRVFDLLRGDEPYKSHLGGVAQICYRIRIVPDRAVAQVRHQVWEATSQFRHWLQSGRSGIPHD